MTYTAFNISVPILRVDFVVDLLNFIVSFFALSRLLLLLLSCRFLSWHEICSRCRRRIWICSHWKWLSFFDLCTFYHFPNRYQGGPAESERQHKELTTHNESATSDKSQATEHSFYCSTDAHSYDYLMVTLIFLFFSFFRHLFLEAPWFISKLIVVLVVLLMFLFFSSHCSFVCHSLIRLRSFVLYILMLSVGLNAIIQINDRLCQRCQMTSNGHKNIWYVRMRA